MHRTFALVSSTGDVAIWRLQPGYDYDTHLAKFGQASFVPAKVFEIDEAIIPKDFSYRDAWTFDGLAFGIDMAKAKAIHEDRLRSELKRQKPPLEAATAAGINAAKTVADLKRVKL